MARAILYKKTSVPLRDFSTKDQGLAPMVKIGQCDRIAPELSFPGTVFPGTVK
jgi:hypothetical protein